MTLDPKLLERIRKLLALGASPNPNEAASAIAHAQRLMQEHGLSQQDLDAAEIEDHPAEDPAMSRARTAPAFEIRLASTVSDAFGVVMMRADGQAAMWKFIGPGPRAQVAAYCFVVLLRQLVQARRDFMLDQFLVVGSRRLIQSGDHFAEGWVAAVAGVIDRVFMDRRERGALAVWLHRNGLVMATSHSRGAGFADNEGLARYAGFEAGSEVQLHRSMRGGAETRRIAS